MKLKNFQKNILKGKKIPKDLEILINNECAYTILKTANFKLIETEEELQKELDDALDNSYLSEEEQKDSDSIADIDAVKEVFKHITFFAIGETMGWFILGYWHGEENADILKSPLVKYTTSENEFTLLYDSNIIESILADYTLEDEDDYEIFKNKFAECGIVLKEIWDLEAPKLTISPDDLYEQLYNDNREKAGLPRI